MKTSNHSELNNQLLRKSISLFLRPKKNKTKIVPQKPYWNWVELGMVTPIREQGKCGACYAFSSAASVESAIAIKTNNLVFLSAQQIIDCSPNYGCVGGSLDKTFSYIKKYGLGIRIIIIIIISLYLCIYTLNL